MPEAIQDGGELPDSALGKIDKAQSSIQELSKACVAELAKMKAHKDNSLIKQSYEMLADYLGQLRKHDANLENIKLMGTDEEGGKASCEGVLRYLSKAAGTLEAAFKHVSACQGLIKGVEASLT